MTDYEGLGTTDRTHPYLLGESEAHGVLDIVRAARGVFGRKISKRFAIVGHSQGGQAALFSAHYASAWTPELRLVGVSAIAPANHLLGLVQAGAGLTVKLPGFAFTPLFLSGAIAGDPSIRAAEVLSDKAYGDLWPHVEQRCRAGLSSTDSWGGLMGTEQWRPMPRWGFTSRRSTTTPKRSSPGWAPASDEPVAARHLRVLRSLGRVRCACSMASRTPRPIRSMLRKLAAKAESCWS